MAFEFCCYSVADGDIEDVSSYELPAKSSGAVLPYVGVACLGAILFGYHLGYAFMEPWKCMFCLFCF